MPTLAVLRAHLELGDVSGALVALDEIESSAVRIEQRRGYGVILDADPWVNMPEAAK